MIEYMHDGVDSDVAAIHARYPDDPVGVPVDGLYAWSPGQEHLFARKVRFSVLAGNPGVAAHARVKDVESRWRLGGDAGAQDAPPFLAERARLGFTDGTVYCSLATVPSVLLACQAARVTVPRWWLAWYWDRPTTPSRPAVLAELRRLTGVDLDPATVWAWQFATFAQWDVSAVFGPFDWSR